MNNFNNVYSPNLHKSLFEGKLLDNDTTGIYLVVFRLLKKDSRILVYNYIYYPNIFVNSLLHYLVVKSNFKNSFIFKEWGDYLSVLSNEFANDSYVKGLYENLHKRNQHLTEYLSTGQLEDIDNYYTLFDILKKSNLNLNMESITRFIDLCGSKQYYDLTNMISFKLGDLSNEKSNEEIYLLKDCLFVVKEIEVLLDNLKKLGYTVGKGGKSKRDQLNSMNSFLGCLDGDYRHSLYNVHAEGVKTGYVPSSLQLSKARFSFRNIHMNIGNIKWYSTSTKKNDRQKLFQENYNIVYDILKSNSFVGSKETQLKIEESLLKQENMFTDNNRKDNTLRFTSENYELLDKVHNELTLLLTHDNAFIENTRYLNTKYLSLTKEIIRELGGDYVASLLLSYFMEILTKESVSLEDNETPGISTIKSFYDFGKTVFTKFVYNKYNKSGKNVSLSNYINSIKNDYDLIYKEDGSYAMLGGYFVWSLVTVKLLFECLDKHPENVKEVMYYLRVLPEVRSKLKKDQIKVFHLPQKLPMVCIPKDYVYSIIPEVNQLGGYLLNDVCYTQELVKSKVGYGEKTKIKDVNLVVELVNGMSKTPYKVNKDTLEYVYKYGIEKKILVDDSGPELKSFLSDPYKSSTTYSNKYYRSLVSKILMERNVLSIADTFSNVEKIYFPLFLDNRTRIYCSTSYFDYQRTDLAKGLLLFANPGLIYRHQSEVIKYFKAYGANMYGNGLDKKSLNYRVKWIEDNSVRLENFESNDIIDYAENKVCFISFCYEYKRFLHFLSNKEDTVFKTYLPIQLDATCNGYQHLSLLTKETKFMSKLNLSVSSHDDDPDDFYSYILSKAKESIEFEILKSTGQEIMTSKDLATLESLKTLKELNLGRSIIKKVIMRHSYSAGIPSLVDSVLTDENMVSYGKGKDTYYKYLNSDIKINRGDIVVFVKMLTNVLSKEALKITALSKYLSKIVSICTALDMEIPWTLPSGAQIAQSYQVEKQRKIAAFSFTKAKYTFKKYLPNKYDVNKQRRAIRPNLIHSLDGTTIALLYNSLDSVDMFTVHDCFAVTANNVPLLIDKLKMVYIKLYSDNNYLLYFDKLVRVTIHQRFGDRVMTAKGKYVWIPYKEGKLKREVFPDVFSVIGSQNENIDTLKESSYIIV